MPLSNVRGDNKYSLKEYLSVKNMGLERNTIYLQYIPYITSQERSIRKILLLPY